jgi:hypothetical protein
MKAVLDLRKMAGRHVACSPEGRAGMTFLVSNDVRKAIKRAEVKDVTFDKFPPGRMVSNS